MKPRAIAGWFVAMTFALSVGCATDSTHHESAATCCSTNRATVSTAFTDKSLYQLDSTWTTDLNQQIKLSALTGRVQIVALIFTSCQFACPLIVHDLQRIDDALPANARSRTGFTLVTIDVERDTPGVLRAYRARQKLPDGRWTLLRGSADDTLELAALLGVKYKRETSGQFAHSNLITVLNADGEIVHQQIGLNQDIAETVKRIVEATTAGSKPGHAHE